MMSGKEAAGADAAAPAFEQLRLRKEARLEATRSAAMTWEMGYLALSALDGVATLNCLKKAVCEEVNPLFGKRPTAARMLLTKAGLGAVHFLTIKAINRRNPRLALRTAQVSAGLQGAIIMFNARAGFR